MSAYHAALAQESKTGDDLKLPDNSDNSMDVDDSRAPDSKLPDNSDNPMGMDDSKAPDLILSRTPTRISSAESKDDPDYDVCNDYPFDNWTSASMLAWFTLPQNRIVSSHSHYFQVSHHILVYNS